LIIGIIELVSVQPNENDLIMLSLFFLISAAWIEMSVHSDLNAAGFTAAFSTILANAGKINLKEVFSLMV